MTVRASTRSMFARKSTAIWLGSLSLMAGALGIWCAEASIRSAIVAGGTFPIAILVASRLRNVAIQYATTLVLTSGLAWAAVEIVQPVLPLKSLGHPADKPIIAGSIPGSLQTIPDKLEVLKPHLGTLEAPAADLPMRCVFEYNSPGSAGNATCMIDGILRDEELIDDTVLWLRIISYPRDPGTYGESVTLTDKPDRLLIPGRFASVTQGTRIFRAMGNFDGYCETLKEIEVRSGPPGSRKIKRKYKIRLVPGEHQRAYCDLIVSASGTSSNDDTPGG